MLGDDLRIHVRAPDGRRISWGPRDLHLYVENDSQAIGSLMGTDRWYTQGLGLSLAGRIYGGPMPLPFDHRFTRRALGIMSAQLMFTPRELDSNIPPADDRPYAGYLYVGGYYQRARDLPDPHPLVTLATMDHLQLDIGMVGPASMARDAQDFWHDLIDEPRASGWDTQVGNEVTFQTTTRKKWRFRWQTHDQRLAVDLIPQLDLALGSVYRKFDTTMVLRAGWRLPDDFGSPRLLDVSSNAVAERLHPSGSWSVYAHGRISGRFVQHNLFLTGRDFRGGSGVQREPLVAEWQFGLTLAYRTEMLDLHLGWSQIYVTDQFKGQRSLHGYASIHAGVTFLF
jgi:lipid A 3-O-deacylase